MAFLTFVYIREELYANSKYDLSIGWPRTKHKGKVIYWCFRNITAIIHYKQECCFNGIFPGEPGLASFKGTKGDGSGDDNYRYKMCKAPVKSSSPTNQALKGSKKKECNITSNSQYNF